MRLRAVVSCASPLRGVDVDHQPVTVLAIRLEQKALGAGPLLHVEHDPQVVANAVAGPGLVALALRRPDACEHPIAGTGVRDPLQQLGVTQIDDHAIGIAQHEQRVLHGTIDVEHDPGVVRCGPRPDVLHVDRGGAHGQRHQAPEAYREEPHVRHLKEVQRKYL